MRPTLAAAAMAVSLAVLAAPASAGWSPKGYEEQSTLEIRTQEAGAEPHWFPVWLVVIDGDVYVRLGNRAASRVENNTTKPVVAVRVAGEEFSSVETEPVPELAKSVAEAMADKYWSDIFVRFMPHPLTLRLKPVD